MMFKSYLTVITAFEKQIQEFSKWIFIRECHHSNHSKSILYFHTYVPVQFEILDYWYDVLKHKETLCGKQWER